MASFSSAAGSVDFETDGDKYTEQREGRVTVQEIPGGDAFYVDRAGRKPQSLTVGMILLNNSAYGTLTAAVGEEGTLTIDSLDSHTVVLMSVSRPAPQVDGRTQATADFIVVDS